MRFNPPALEKLDAVRNSDVAAPEDGRAPVATPANISGEVSEGLSRDGLVRASRPANQFINLPRSNRRFSSGALISQISTDDFRGLE